MVPEAVGDLIGDVSSRCFAEPDVDDFLLWWGGTLEYWIHVIASGIGRRTGWASQSEIPYITGCPAPSSKSNVKWGDGAVVWPDGVGALIEVKTIPMKAALGKAIEQVPKDMAALVSADWEATLAHQRGSDTYTDPSWWDQRRQMTAPWAVQFALVHGRQPLGDIDDLVRAGVAKGTASLRYRFRGNPPQWLDRLEEAFQQTPRRYEGGGPESAGVMFAWACQIPV